METPVETEVRQQAPGKRRPWPAAVAAIVLLLLAAVAYYAARFGRLKGTEPYRMAVQRVKQAEEVAQRLGGPVDDVTWFPSGEIVAEGSRGRARFTFIVAGPRGRATVLAQANRVGDQWALTLLDVAFDDGGRVSLRESGGGSSGIGQAPRWQPGGSAQPGTAPPAIEPGVSPPAAPSFGPAQPGVMPGQPPADVSQPGPTAAGQAPQLEIHLPEMPHQ